MATDFDWLFGSEDWADVQLVLREEDDDNDDDDRGGDSSRQQAAVVEEALPAHALALMGGSGFCKVKLQHWSAGGDDAGGGAGGGRDQDEEQQPPAAKRHRGNAGAAAAGPISTRPRVVLHVPRGQLGIGRRLVRAIYEAKPALGDLGAEQLAHLLLLADRYEAPKVVEAAAAALGVDAAVVSKHGPDWAIVLTAYNEAAEGAPAPTAGLLGVADAALQRQLGDLELVWAHPNSEERASKQRLFKKLPFAALKALLASEQTRVASENTAFHTVQRWLTAHQAPAADARAKALLGLVRVQHMTPHYARTVFCASELAKAHLSEQELDLAAMLPLVDVATTCIGAAAVGKKHPNWLMAARPRSALADGVTLEWRLPLAELERCVEQRLRGGGGCLKQRSACDMQWQGWPLWLDCIVLRPDYGALHVWPFLSTWPPASRAVAAFTFGLELVGAQGNSIKNSCRTHLVTSKKTSYTSCGFPATWGFDHAIGDWAGVEAWLRGTGLVHSSAGGAGGGGGGGGVEVQEHLLLRCEVTRLQ